MSRSVRMAVSVVLFGVIALQGCASTETKPVEAYNGFPLTEIDEEGAVLLWHLSAREDGLVAPCMAEQGFEFEQVRRNDQPPSASDDVVLTVERAREFGYRNPSPLKEEGSSEYFDGLSAEARVEWALALFGSEDARVIVETSAGRMSVPGNGCLADAREALAGSVEVAAGWIAALNEVQFLRYDAQQRATADDAVLSATESWSTCMAERGFDVSTREEAVQLAWSKDFVESSAPAQWEIDVAVADAECRTLSTLDEVWRDRLSYYENQVLGENEGALLAWHDASSAMQDLLAADIVTRP